MKQFGYLAEGAPNTEALHTEEAITDAVKQMQIYGGLDPSGIINEDTLNVKTIIEQIILFQCLNLVGNVETRMEQMIEAMLTKRGQRGLLLVQRDGKKNSHIQVNIKDYLT